MPTSVHFIFSGSQNVVGGGVTAWKNLLAHLTTNLTVYLHYSSFAEQVWDTFRFPYLRHVVHEGWKTYERKSAKYYDKSFLAFRFDTIEEGATVVFDASECVRQLADTLARKQCQMYWHVQSPEHYLHKNVYRTAREWASIQKLTKLIFISHYVKSVFERDILYRLLGRAVPSSVVYYGIPEASSPVTAEYDYIIYFGRYEQYKNPLFLQALTGDIRYIGTIGGCTSPVEIPPTVDLGWMAPDEAARYGDIFVFPSLDEAFGLAVIEMMSYGKIPICFDSGAFPEMVEHGVDGFLISPFDTAAANRYISDVQQDPDVRHSLRHHAVAKARQFSIKIYQESFFQEIQRE